MTHHNHLDPGPAEGCPACFPPRCAICGRVAGMPTAPCPDCPGQPGSAVVRYADEAMYAAAPLVRPGETVEPTVTILSMTPNPLRVIAAVNQMYRGDPVHSPDDVPRSMALEALETMKRTTLQAPLEWVHFSFLVEGVSRAFTHQMVRQRTAAYAQESLRFAVKDNVRAEVVMPPAFAMLPEKHPLRLEWEDHVSRTAWLYNHWIEEGIPAEDARGGLLINTATRLHYDTSLRGLTDHSGYRLCSQAQYEWKMVWVKIIQAINEYGPESERWQQQAITTLFKPICFQTGKCEFMGKFDRYCVIRDRVEAHHAAGEAPETWRDISVYEPLGYAAARKPNA